jgi:hypothetical protein
LHTGYNGTAAYAPPCFKYLESGARGTNNKISNAGSVLTYEYNSIGQIIKVNEVSGKS